MSGFINEMQEADTWKAEVSQKFHSFAFGHSCWPERRRAERQFCRRQ
jgi:hypothetical protein